MKDKDQLADKMDLVLEPLLKGKIWEKLRPEQYPEIRTLAQDMQLVTLSFELSELLMFGMYIEGGIKA